MIAGVILAGSKACGTGKSLSTNVVGLFDACHKPGAGTNSNARAALAKRASWHPMNVLSVLDDPPLFGPHCPPFHNKSTTFRCSIVFPT